MYKHYLFSNTPIMNSDRIPIPTDGYFIGDIILSYIPSEKFTTEVEMIQAEGFPYLGNSFPSNGSFVENKIIEINLVSDVINLDCVSINLDINNNNGELITYLPINTKIYTNNSWNDVTSSNPIHVGDAYFNWKNRWKVICTINKDIHPFNPFLYEIITEKDNIVLESFIIKS